MNKTHIQILLITLFITLSLIFSACATSKDSNRPLIPHAKQESKPEPKRILDIKKCVCIQLWMPVCGADGKTYSNSCFANCAGVVFKQGECEQKK